MDYVKEKEEAVFDINYRGFNIQAFYLSEPKDDALIVVTKDEKPFREFLYPAYKIWNIAAHIRDIVDFIELEMESLYK